jgi:hypothetical protein
MTAARILATGGILAAFVSSLDFWHVPHVVAASGSIMLLANVGALWVKK